MAGTHTYSLSVRWTGNLGTGTSDYRAYRRDHEICGPGKGAVIAGSSDPAFRGDASRYNPEELLVSTLSTCHMLWVLHLCAEAGLVLTEYTDEPSGEMRENADGSGEFVSVTLRPRVVLQNDERSAELHAVHERAHALCFIARSVNFPVRCEPSAG